MLMTSCFVCATQNLGRKKSGLILLSFVGTGRLFPKE